MRSILRRCSAVISSGSVGRGTRLLPKLLPALGIAGGLAAATAPAASAGVFDDTSFDRDGRLLLQEVAFARDVAVQPDGKIVLAGSDDGDRVALWRLHPNGSLDRSFSGDGRTVVDVGGRGFGNAVAVAPDGKIVVVGQLRTGIATDDFLVLRLERDGDVDKTFNPGGTRPGLKVLDGDGYSRAHDVLVQGDGRIVVAGRGVDDYAIARLELDGDVDGTAFELDGAGSGLSSLDAVALDGAGRIVAGGSAGVARFLGSGALDDTFAGDGTAAAPSDTSNVSDVLVEPGGALVIAGDAGGADPRMFLARMSAKGEIDAMFGSGGTAAPEFEGFEAAVAVVRQADGKLLLVGTAAEAGVTMAVARYDARGVLDPGYGAAGRLTLPFGFPSAAGDAALQPDGRLVVAGAVDVGNQDPRPAVARVLRSPRRPGDDGGDAAPDTRAPTLSALKVTRKAAGKRARIAFKLSEPARVKLTLTRRGRRAQRFALDAVAGANRARTPRRLKRGRYRLSAVATDAAGNAAAPVRVRFRLRAGAR